MLSRVLILGASGMLGNATLRLFAESVGFEVFGADILFDEKKPYLLEFNNKMGHKSISFYARGFLDTVFGNTSNPYFTRIL